MSLLSAHKLITENGRYLNIPREQRLCKACNEIEDETHIIDKMCKIQTNEITTVKTLRVKSASDVTKPSNLFLFNKMQNILAERVFECSSLSA